MEKWQFPPSIKILEALGAVIDGRLRITGNTAKVYSSSMGKYYTVEYKPEDNAISANDNGSYWQGYLGYPAIAFLIMKEILPYDEKVVEKLKDIKWKDINVKNKNNYQKTVDDIYQMRQFTEIEKEALSSLVKDILAKIMELELNMIEPLPKPPSGY